MRHETRIEFAKKLLNSQLLDIKATRDGMHLCLFGKLADGRYFAARFDGKSPLDYADKVQEASLARVEVSYCSTLAEAEWMDDYYYMRACSGYDKEN